VIGKFVLDTSHACGSTALC